MGCTTPGRFVWVDQYRDPAPPLTADYQLQQGDVVSIRVLGHEDMSGAQLKVRADGKITAPYVGDVDVAGKPPTQVAGELTAAMRAYVQNPVVAVTVDEPRPFTVSVLGEVARPGNYTLESGANVLHALASAGGLTQFAHEDGVYVLRRAAGEEQPTRIRFDYRALSRAEGAAAAFRLRSRDVVVVE